MLNKAIIKKAEIIIKNRKEWEEQINFLYTDEQIERAIMHISEQTKLNKDKNGYHKTNS